MENMYVEQLLTEEDGPIIEIDPAYLSQLISEDGEFDIQNQFLLPPPPTSLYQESTGRPKNKVKGVGDKSYVCHFCDCVCTNSSNLKAHLRTHTGERPYVCDICHLAFVQHSNLKAHMRTHTGEKPYTCDICRQTFNRSSHLTGHMRTHTGEKPYICGTCGEPFATSTHLRNHFKKHTAVSPYTCNICEVSFLENALLQSHMKVHNGDRPFKCCDCGGEFRSKSDHRSHRKLHAQDRPFICGKCGRTFKTYPYLLKHLKKCPTALISFEQESPDLSPAIVDIPDLTLIGDSQDVLTEISNPDQMAMNKFYYNSLQWLDESGNTFSLKDLVGSEISEVSQISVADIEAGTILTDPTIKLLNLLSSEEPVPIKRKRSEIENVIHYEINFDCNNLN